MQQQGKEGAAYWRQLHHDGAITEQPWPAVPPAIQFSSEELDLHRSTMRTDGYALAEACIPEPYVDRALGCVEAVMSAGHEPRYALLYDECFALLACASPLLEALLGADFQIVPDEPDVYFVETSPNADLTPPHRDTLRAADMFDAGGLPQIVNLWIPLTNTTPLNSCMHVVPASVDPRYHPNGAGGGPILGASQLQNVRALPAPAGSILIWSTQLLHWGGRPSRYATEPRVSIAMYFQSGRVAPFHPTAMSLPFTLPFDYRMYLIEKVFNDPDGNQLAHFLPG